MIPASAHIPQTLELHDCEVSTPSAAAILMVTVLTWGAAWGAQLMWASSITPGGTAEASGYWFVYATIAAAFAVWLHYLWRLLRLKVHMLLPRRTRRARLSASEHARQYLLRRETRERNRPQNGTCGPVPQHWRDYLNERRIED